jgi:uncharacterized protein with ParB-like and HNH nuclease domain
VAQMNFNTTNSTFRQIIGNGLTYKVPPFQRDYSWSVDEWDDLWQDMTGLFSSDPESAHYMGYLVLQSTDNKQFDLIDGQQRITTLSIIILCCLKCLSDLVKSKVELENNTKRIEQLRNSFIGYLDPVTLIPRSKLELNRHNNKFFQSYLVPLLPVPIRGLNASETLLRKAFDWFYEKIKHTYANSGESIARFIEKIADSLFFTVITVTDELNAFKVFETLNARGVRLSSTDLLKNYLFSVINKSEPHETEMKQLEEDWEVIVDRLGSENMPDFFRVFWNSRNPIVRKADLFKTIRKKITSKQEAFTLIRSLKESASIYFGLQNASDKLWNKEEVFYLEQLSMFNVSQPIPLLLAVFENLRPKSPESFTKILHHIWIISFRYNVICNLQTNEQERIYNEISQDVSNGSIRTEKDILVRLKNFYPNDPAFKIAFEEKILKTTNSRNKKIVRSILFALEKQVTGNDLDSNSDQYSVEHILPENPSEKWEFDENKDTDFIYRLGNMTLLETNLNREIGNAGPADKLAIYQESTIGITRKIPDEYQDWNRDKIKSRQIWMAKQATAIWRIDFPS